MDQSIDQSALQQARVKQTLEDRSQALHHVLDQMSGIVISTSDNQITLAGYLHVPEGEASFGRYSFIHTFQPGVKFKDYRTWSGVLKSYLE